MTRGLFQEDLIKAHFKRASWDDFKSRDDWDSYLEYQRPEQLWEALLASCWWSNNLWHKRKAVIVIKVQRCEGILPDEGYPTIWGCETIQLPLECTDLPSKIDLVDQQWAIKSWACSRKVWKSTLREVINVLYPTHQNMKKRWVSEESTYPIPKNNLIHQIECLKREVEEQRTLIEIWKKKQQPRLRFSKKSYLKFREKIKSSQSTVVKPKDVNEHWKWCTEQELRQRWSLKSSGTSLMMLSTKRIFVLFVTKIFFLFVFLSNSTFFWNHVCK